MTLQSWLQNRWLTPHDPSAEEVVDLLAAVDRDLDDAALDRLSRNLSTYERAGMTSPSEADEVYRLATRLREDVITWLADRHPDLLPDA